MRSESTPTRSKGPCWRRFPFVAAEGCPVVILQVITAQTTTLTNQIAETSAYPSASIREEGTDMSVRIAAAARGGLLALVLAGCGIAPPYPAPSGSMTTMMPGWERFFSIEWTVGTEPDGSRRVDGYVVNRYGEYAADIRILIQGLDASGNVVDRRIAWVPAGAGG